MDRIPHGGEEMRVLLQIGRSGPTSVCWVAVVVRGEYVVDDPSVDLVPRLLMLMAMMMMLLLIVVRHIEADKKERERFRVWAKGFVGRGADGG